MIKKASKLIAIFILLVTVLTAFSSCTVKRLNAWYEHKTGVDTCDYWIDFYGINKFITHDIIYDPITDLYRAERHTGTYKIYEDPENPGNLLIKFNCDHSKSAVHTYEEIISDDGSMAILLDGMEFTLTYGHPFGYVFKQFLRNNGWIK